MGPDTTYALLHQIRGIVTHPVTVLLGPESCVILSAMLFSWIGDKESLRKKQFWRLSGAWATGGLGLVVTALLLFASRAESLMRTGTAEARQFVLDFQAVGWICGMGFTALYFLIMWTTRSMKNKKPLLLDPVLPDFLALLFLVGASWVVVNIAKHI
jgi:hypothetical protein